MSDIKKIETNKIPNVRFASLDPRGRTFIYDGKFLRGIYPEAENAIRQMFECGLVDELVSRKLIPSVRISDYYSDEFAIILEHELITPVTYIFEWTYHMLCDAGKMIMELRKVLDSYGYKMWDCHAYNVLFMGSDPVFVDFGSIYRQEDLEKHPFPIEEFRCNYIKTAELLRKQGYLMRCMIKVNDGISLSNLIRIDKGLGGNCYVYKVADFLCKVNSVIYSRLGFYEKCSIKFYEKKIKSLYNKEVFKSRWSGYQKIDPEMLENIHSWNSEAFGRFDKLKEIISKLDIESIFEWGGNKGILAMLLCGNLEFIKNYYCCDYDDYSVDTLYCFIKQYEQRYTWLKKITPLVGSFFDPIFLREYNGSKRMKADLVIGCAISHHLLLAQGLNIDVMFDTFASYTNKYIIIEFMPLGLWDGRSKTPKLPDYYSLDWFLEHMRLYFDVEVVEKLEKNRILIFGKKWMSEKDEETKKEGL